MFRALRQSFANARGIQVTLSLSLSLSLPPLILRYPTQDWLSISARKVALAKRPMEWVTPLGLPVVQPYHKPQKKEVQFLLSLRDFMLKIFFASVLGAYKVAECV